MSNSIWKTPNVKPKNTNDIVCMVGDMFFIGIFDKYQGLYKSRGGMLYDTDEIDRWGYLEDIIAQADKAERLQKAVDLAIQGLERVHGANACITKESQIAYEYLYEIKQLIKGE